MRLVICENSNELITCAPHTGEFESLNDAKRCAERRQKFIFTELAIETEAGDLIACRPVFLPWIDCVDPHLLGQCEENRDVERAMDSTNTGYMAGFAAGRAHHTRNVWASGVYCPRQKNY